MNDRNSLRTAEEWRALKHPNAVILDPDGWRRRDGVTLDTPITEDDFDARFLYSTIRESQ